MDDAAPVGIVERRRRLCHHGGNVHSRLRPVRNPVGERPTGHERHDREQHALDLARVDDRHDVRMHELRRGARLTPKTLEHLGIPREMSVQHLEHQRPSELGVFREVYARHPASAEPLLHLVAAARRLPKLGDLLVRLLGRRRSGDFGKLRVAARTGGGGAAIPRAAIGTEHPTLRTGDARSRTVARGQ